MKSNKKCFYRSVSSKRKAWENNRPAPKWGRKPVRENKKMPTYSMPFSPQPLLVRLAFRNSRPLRLLKKFKARKTYCRWKRIRLGNI